MIQIQKGVPIAGTPFILACHTVPGLTTRYLAMPCLPRLERDGLQSALGKPNACNLESMVPRLRQVC